MTFIEVYVSSFWAWAGITFGASMVIDGICKCWSRWLRSRNIARHGWPTAPNMDADGDIVHPKQEGAA